MAGEGSRFLEAASAVGRKACPEEPKIDPADPPLTTSQPISRRARLACTRPSSLKRPIALKSKAVLGRASHRICAWRSAGVLLRLWRSGVLDLAFCPLAFCPGVLGGAGVLGLAFWSPGVLGLAFWAAWRSGSGVLACLAFCLAFCPGVLGPGVLLAFWRSAGVLPGVLAFCWRPGVLLAFWRSAWRSAQLRVALPPCCSLHQSEGVQFFSSRFGFV